MSYVDLYLDEKVEKEEMLRQLQQQYRASVPGLLKPDEVVGLDQEVSEQ